MNINNFIESIEERAAAEDESGDIIEHIAAQFGPEQDESDEEDVEQPKIKITEAILALQQLQLYEEQQEESNTRVLNLLNRYEQQIQGRRIRDSQQTSITAFFNANRSGV